MIQTESPYYQGSANTQAPAPFGHIFFDGDTSFRSCGSATTSCNNAWALVVQNSASIYINGAGLYSWFQNYDESCVNTADCQEKMIYVHNSASLYLKHVITIGAVEMISPSINNEHNEIVMATSNLQGSQYPWWSVVGTYLDSSYFIDETATPPPVRNGWVAFGDSYAAGIGAGDAVDNPDHKKCLRGDGGYPWFLDANFKLLANHGNNFQPLACSGDVVNDMFKPDAQLELWYPQDSDLATLSISGNDFKFGPIVETCIVGYTKDPDCNSQLSSAEALLEDDVKIRNLLFSVWTAIQEKSTRPQFVIYQTGYPQFFQNTDQTCNADRFWVGMLGWYYYGEYLTQPLRSRMNQLSVNINEKISSLVDEWNANLNRKQVVFVPTDESVFPGHRYCEEGKTEPLTGNDQNNVGFFYPKGDDYTGTDTDGTSGTWPTVTYSSANCASLDLTWWGDRLICDTAIAAASNSTLLGILQSDIEPGLSITVDGQGHILATDLDVKYAKMFHPKSLYNQKVGLQVLTSIITNQAE